MRCLAHGRVVHVQVIANGAHHHLAAIEAHAHLYCEPLRAPHLLGVAVQSGLHGERRIAGPHRMVLMRYGRAKERHNAIAQHLIDGALDAVHRVHHQMDGRVEELLRGFRIETTDEFRRVLEVGKEHRDLFALAFQRCARSQDFLCKIGRGVGQRGLPSDRA